MNKKIVIYGGGGFIGSSVAVELASSGYDVVVFDSFTKQIHGDNYRQSELYDKIRDKCLIIHNDIRRAKEQVATLENTDCVVNFAAETGTGQSMYSMEHYTDVNINGTSVLLETLAECKCKPRKLVVASSRAIYGEGKYKCMKHGTQYPESRIHKNTTEGQFEPLCSICGQPMVALPTDESSRINPTSIYGITKQVQEQMVLMFARMIGIGAVALRYQNVYGPGQSLKNPYTGILSIFSTAMLQGNPIEIFEDGKETRDFVYIDDVVRATVAAIESEDDDVYSVNVGSGVPVSVEEVAKKLKEIYGSRSVISVSGRYRLGDIRHNFADLERAGRRLGYAPTVNFDEGLKSFANWVLKQKLEADKYQASLKEMIQKGLLK